MREVQAPNIQEKYVERDGRLTLEGMKLFAEWADAMAEAKAELDDHETRITALEP